MTIVPSKLHHVSRQTKQLDITRKFYVDVLGFREILRPGFQFKGAWLFGAGIQIHLIEEPFDAPPVEINSRENHIAFAVDDLKAAEEVLREHGVTYRENIVPERNLHQLFLRDPDGWMIELAKFPAAMDQ